MKILLLTESSLRLEPSEGEGTIESGPGGASFSPFHMIAAGLATCTSSVLHLWAKNANLDASTLALEVAWSFADNPHRIGELNVRIDWPTLPMARRDAAQRAAEQCTVHATLQHPPQITIAM